MKEFEVYPIKHWQIIDKPVFMPVRVFGSHMVMYALDCFWAEILFEACPIHCSNQNVISIDIFQFIEILLKYIVLASEILYVFSDIKAVVDSVVIGMHN